MKNRTVSLLLSLTMIISMFTGISGFSVSAAEITSEPTMATASQTNMVLRADAMYNCTWVSQKSITGWRDGNTFTKGSTYRIPYGQPINSGKYVGYGVSVSDFLTATTDASSVFYTGRSEYSGKISTYYATDCSAFVSYCWGVSRNTTATLGYISTSYGLANSSNVDKIKIGDALNLSSSHVVLVTDVTYESNGTTVKNVEITEQTPPQLKRTTYTRSGLVSKYGSSYYILRYNGTVPAPIFTFKFNANGGSGTMADQTINYGVSTKISANTFTRTGYKFKGWNAYRNSSKLWYYTDGTNSGWYTKGSQPSGYSLKLYKDAGSVSKTGYGVSDTVTMYAVWEEAPSTFTLAFDANGGTGTMAKQTITYGTSTQINANQFTKEGCTFAGWRAYRSADQTYYCRNAAGDKGWYKKADIPKGYYYNLYKDGATVAKTGLGTGDTVKMVAQWAQAKYTVAYDANGGTGTMESTSHKNGVSKCLSANTFTKSKCTFAGWYLSRKSDGKSIYTNGTSRGWYVPGTQPEGYRLDIYEDEQMFSALSSSEGDVVTCYAQWTPKATGTTTFYVDYNANGGTGTMEKTTIVYGEDTKTAVGTFTKSGYKITGWAAHRRSDDKWAFQDAGGNRVWLTAEEKAASYPSYTIKPYANGCTIHGTSKVDRDIVTFYAVWAPIDYTIEFDSNGGTGTMSGLSTTYNVSNTLTANSYKKSGYTFSGWNALRASDSKWYCVDTTTDTKSWLAEGSITGNVVKYAFADKESVKNLTKTDADKITMKAVWTPITYKIAFDANGGTGKMSNLSMVYDVSKALTANGYEMKNYNFLGWNAFRASDSKWYCIDTSSNTKSWLTEESITGNIVKYTFANKESVNKLTKVDADKVTMKAVWTPAHTINNIGYVDLGADFYAVISSNDSNMALAITKDLAGLEFNLNTSSSTQIWRFTRQTNGTYQIMSTTNGKYIDSKNANVQIAAKSDAETQNWYIVENGDGTYTFIPENGVTAYVAMGVDSTGALIVSEFAKTNEQKFNIEQHGEYMRGDVNMDGEIDVNDVTKLQKLLLFEDEIDANLIFIADTNCDGVVDINDATLIQKYCAGIVDYI